MTLFNHSIHSLNKELLQQAPMRVHELFLFCNTLTKLWGKLWKILRTIVLDIGDLSVARGDIIWEVNNASRLDQEQCLRNYFRGKNWEISFTFDHQREGKRERLKWKLAVEWNMLVIKQGFPWRVKEPDGPACLGVTNREGITEENLIKPCWSLTPTLPTFTATKGEGAGATCPQVHANK